MGNESSTGRLIRALWDVMKASSAVFWEMVNFFVDFNEQKKRFLTAVGKNPILTGVALSGAGAIPILYILWRTNPEVFLSTIRFEDLPPLSQKRLSEAMKNINRHRAQNTAGRARKAKGNNASKRNNTKT